MVVQVWLKNFNNARSSQFRTEEIMATKNPIKNTKGSTKHVLREDKGREGENDK